MSDSSVKAPPSVRATAPAEAAPRSASRIVKVGPATTPEAPARAMATGPTRPEAPAMFGGPSPLVIETRRKAQNLRASVTAALQHARKAMLDIDALADPVLTDEERAVYQVEGIDLVALSDFSRRCRVLVGATVPETAAATLAGAVDTPPPTEGA